MSTNETGDDKEVEKVFSRKDEVDVIGTIVITLYESRPYDVEFSGRINGRQRDLAIKFLMRDYMRWKAELAKKGEKLLKLRGRDKVKLGGNEDARNK